jgi:signal transduction histidine kinase/ActR/RegA family two-component response regulator
MINPVSALTLLSVFVSLLAAVSVYPLGRVPDWEDLRPLTWVGFTAALMAGANLVATFELPDPVYLWCARLQVLGVALHLAAWHTYLPGWARRPERIRLWPLLALGALAMVPGAVFGDRIHMRPVHWLGVVYRDPELTWTGQLIWAGLGAYGIWGLLRVVRWGRGGAPYPRAHLLCTGALLLMAAHDGLVAGGVPLATPYLLDFGGFAPMTVFAVVTVRRIAESAAGYQRLRHSLETTVVERTRMLDESRAALARAERLAALGQFSAGVAHEVNNPAAAVAANLAFLAGELRGHPEAEVRQSLDDARAGVQRIVGLARQLLLAGRTASGTSTPIAAVRLEEALEPALASARARAEDRAVLRVEVRGVLWVSAQKEPLVQVLSNLLVNAVQAIPATRTGTVCFSAAEEGDRVRLVVEDDGVGMSEEELRHVFEPFYSTKAPGMGTGLGLAVARNLVEGMRGSLRFESELGRGTRAILELARTAEPTSPGEALPQAPSPAPRARLLVIDDDPQVLRSMARLLGRQHEVEVAGGTEEGLGAVLARPFDLVLCDVMMPAGGGERFWAEVLLRAPTQMDRVVFMTGGAATREARAFLRRQPRPILAKPFDVSAVDELLLQAGRAPASPVPGAAAPPSPQGAPGRLDR